MDAKTKELARQVGFDVEDSAGDGEIWFDEGWYTSLVERLAALIRADEREAIIDIVAIHGGSVEIEAAIRQRDEK